jgi:hypothetical protein
MEDWLWIVVDDRSEVKVPDFDDVRVSIIESQGQGVAHARNSGAEKAQDGPILFLDHDDWLPSRALETFLDGHKKAQAQERKDFGWVVYGDTDLVAPNSVRHYSPPEFSMEAVLNRIPMMPIGSLHLKRAWAKIGGFDPGMEFGLEDWEYWVNLARSGVCGWKVDETVYKYRMHNRGRRAFLNSNDEHMTKAQGMVRTIHQDLFNGERPMGCCGGSRRPRTTRPKTATVQKVNVASTTESDYVLVVYRGLQRGFHLRGKTSGIQYYVEAPGEYVRVGMAGRYGMHKSDLPHLRAYGPGVFEVEK